MSDVVVVDASLAIKWILAEPDSAAAIMLLNKWTNEGTKIIAPALFAMEFSQREIGLGTCAKRLSALTSHSCQKRHNLIHCTARKGH